MIYTPCAENISVNCIRNITVFISEDTDKLKAETSFFVSWPLVLWDFFFYELALFTLSWLIEKKSEPSSFRLTRMIY